MYTATILNKELNDGSVAIDVAFSDGKTTLNETIKTSKDLDFNVWIKSRLQELNGADALYATLAEGVFTVKEDVKPVPTVDELARTEYFKNYQKLLYMKELLDLGIIDDRNEDYITLKQTVISQYRFEY
jgi:hypothetical protein